MRYLIIGLGTFGRRLAEELTDNGHDVVVVDSNRHRVEYIKERVSVAYIMDASEKEALKSLPLDEFDCAVVTIGRSMESSLRTVAALKQLGVKKIYARAVDHTHKSILVAMEIHKIFIPESYSARIFAGKIVSDEDFIME